LWKLRGKDDGDGPSLFVSMAVHNLGDDGAYDLASLSVSLPVKRAFWPPHMTRRDMVDAEELGDDRWHGVPESKQRHVKHLETRGGVKIFHNLTAHSQIN
jgi:hypothetical protein